MLRAALAVAVLLALALPAAPARAAEPCSGDPAQINEITLTVDGQPATGVYALPSGPPRGLVVFAHGASNTSNTWERHLPAVAAREGVITVAMDYRGMQVTGTDANRGTETARGWPAKAGSEDLVAAAQHFDARCPGLPGIVLYGVSMGGNMSGLAAAAKATRAGGAPLFDYWFAIEGVHNFVESYQEARAAAVHVAFAKTTQEDMEAETGGSFEQEPDAFAQRTNLNRVPDIAASGLRGVVLVHAFEDGTVPYNQSAEMAQRLRSANVPTDLYSVGGRGSDEKDTTIGSYGGVQTGNAGHGWEGSFTHVVIQTGFDRLSALITRGAPAPCDRDFLVEDSPDNVSPDPRRGPAGCEPDPLPPAQPPEDPGDPGPPAGPAAECTDTSRPARVVVDVRRRGRRPDFAGRAADRGCGRVARVRVSLGRRVGKGKCRYLNRKGRLGARRSCRKPRYVTASGQETWRLSVRRRLPRGRYVVRARAVDEAGYRGPAGPRVRFRIRR